MLLEFADPDQGMREAQRSRLLEELKRLGPVLLDVFIAPRELFGHPIEALS
jgi:hypothetical protein